MSEFERYFRDVIENICPQEKYEGRIVERGGSGGGCGDGGVVSRSGVIDSGDAIAGTSVISSTIGDVRR